MKRSVKKLNYKQKRFSDALRDARYALESIGIPFHAHSGTALGAVRSKSFIQHTDDIDLGVFIKDYKRNLVTSMKRNGFSVEMTSGKLKFGKEYQFIHEKTGVRVDIFLVYVDKLKNEQTGKHEEIYWVSSFFGECDDKKYGMCRWKYRPYEPVPAVINGMLVYSAPESALEDGYGPDWKVPKKFDYFEGIEKKYYTNLIDE